MKRWRGLKALVVDGVEHGSKAVEKIQIETMKLPFDLLEQIDPIKEPVKGIREIHDTAVTQVHGMIRLVNRVVGSTLDVVLDEVEQRKGPDDKAGRGDSATSAAGTSKSSSPDDPGR